MKWTAALAGALFGLATCETVDPGRPDASAAHQLWPAFTLYGTAGATAGFLAGLGYETWRERRR